MTLFILVVFAVVLAWRRETADDVVELSAPAAPERFLVVAGGSDQTTQAARHVRRAASISRGV